MNKVIIIDKCSNCPYVEFAAIEDKQWSCKKKGSKIKATKTFPPTCPLDKD